MSIRATFAGADFPDIFSSCPLRSRYFNDSHSASLRFRPSPYSLSSPATQTAERRDFFQQSAWAKIFNDVCLGLMMPLSATILFKTMPKVLRHTLHEAAMSIDQNVTPALISLLRAIALSIG